MNNKTGLGVEAAISLVLLAILGKCLQLSNVVIATTCTYTLYIYNYIVNGRKQKWERRDEYYHLFPLLLFCHHNLHSITIVLTAAYNYSRMFFACMFA